MNTIMHDAFKSYGKVLSGFDFKKLADELEVLVPESGNQYVASVSSLEKLSVFTWLKENVFGKLDIQLGTCAGHNQKITAVEYHQGSEVVVALSDCILCLGHVYDIVDETYDADLMEHFLLKKGQAVELYGTTLHYSPLEIDRDGYSTLVALLKGTNENITVSKASLLVAKNKFMLVHSSRKDKIDKGALAGFTNKEI